MNIQANKENLAARTIMLDANNRYTEKVAVRLPVFGNNEELLQTEGRKILANAAIRSIGQTQVAQASEMKSQEEQTASDNAVKKAEGEGMEKAQAQQDEQEQFAEREKAKKKKTFTLPAVPGKESNFVRNALIIGGASTASIVGGATMFPLFFGNA